MTDQRDEGEQGKQGGSSGTPALEWIASGIGLALTLGILGTIGWEAVKGEENKLPAIAISVERIVATEAGYAVEVTARNLSPATASHVEIEGQLAGGATSSMTLDYLPGESERKGGLFFKEDPRTRQLEVRALGYEEP